MNSQEHYTTDHLEIWKCGERASCDGSLRTVDVESRRRLRSASTDKLIIPSMHLSTVGDRAFSVATARSWNSEVILTVLHVLSICTFYYDSRRYFSYIVRCPSSHY